MDARLVRPKWRDRTNVDALTIACIEHAEQLLGRRLVLTQGSYQNSVSASAGTHNKGGVVDISVSGMSEAEKTRVVRALRRAGMAAWLRRSWQGPWKEHIHAVVVGHPLLAPAAARQVVAYLNRRNGLANNGPDDGPRLDPIPRPVWPWPPVKQFGTWNGYVGQSPKNFAKGVDTILDKFPELRSLSLQECSRAIKNVRAVAKAHNFAVVRGKALGVEGKSTLLLVNRRFEIPRTGALVMDTPWIGPKVQAKHPGRVFPTTVVDGARSTAVHLPPGPVKNKAAVQDSLALLRNRGNNWREQAIWLGDWNLAWADKGPDSVRRLAKQLGGRIVHDEARIDYAIVRGFDHAKYESYGKLGSDTHRYGILTVR